VTARQHGNLVVALGIGAGVLLLFLPWLMGLFR
jgi:hypothetical protein